MQFTPVASNLSLSLIELTATIIIIQLLLTIIIITTAVSQCLIKTPARVTRDTFSSPALYMKERDQLQDPIAF
jgi:hypothetical protein